MLTPFNCFTLKKNLKQGRGRKSIYMYTARIQRQPYKESSI
jgi:hypothetical protein